MDDEENEGHEMSDRKQSNENEGFEFIDDIHSMSFALIFICKRKNLSKDVSNIHRKMSKESELTTFSCKK